PTHALLLLIPPPPRSPLFPYTTLFRSGAAPTANELESNSFQPRSRQLWGQVEFNNGFSISGGQTWSLLTTNRSGNGEAVVKLHRSEEHTSELQSRGHLVCRLLLEKKKK